MTTIGLSGLPSGLRRLLWGVWYEYVARLLDDHPYEFLNFGYAPAPGEPFRAEVKPKDEDKRPFVELYHRVVAPVGVEGKRVLEVSCGRGGGAGYVWEVLRPNVLVGVDRSQGFIAHCRGRFRGRGLRFEVGDAEDLGFLSQPFDVVVNIEASHAYGSRERFFVQAYRVLGPGGCLAIADFCQTDRIAGWERGMLRAGFEILDSEDISDNVVRSLGMTDKIRLRAVREASPAWLYPLFRNFTGAPGSRVVAALRSGDLRYLRYVLGRTAVGSSSATDSGKFELN